jgi:cytochrome P450
LRDIHYLDWCLSETTRMYGPATSILLRQARTHTYIHNIPIIEGTGIKIEMLASHYNPNIYKDPFQFDPTRWSIQDAENHPFSFGGFGSGAHSCIGKQLALLSSKIIICVMLLRYDNLEVEDGEKVQMVTRGLYQPTFFRNVLTKRQQTEEERETAQRVR